jgi:hypothetical protein
MINPLREKIIISAGESWPHSGKGLGRKIANSGRRESGALSQILNLPGDGGAAMQRSGVRLPAGKKGVGQKEDIVVAPGIAWQSSWPGSHKLAVAFFRNPWLILGSPLAGIRGGNVPQVSSEKCPNYWNPL